MYYRGWGDVRERWRQWVVASTRAPSLAMALLVLEDAMKAHVCHPSLCPRAPPI